MITLEQVIARYSGRENPRKAERRVELVAIVLLLILGLQVLLGLVSIVRPASVAAIPPSQDVLNVGRLEKVAQIKADARNQIVSRPLFWAGRVPIVAAEIVVAEASPEGAGGEKIKGVKMLGVYGSATAGGAILQVKKTRRRVAVGEEVEGWLLDAVGPNSATFVKDGSVDELVLQRVDASKIVKVVPSAPKQEPKSDQDGLPAKGPMTLGGIERG